MMHRAIFTGGPGAGKSTVLNLLSERGYDVAPDHARQIIRERKAAGLSPRPDPAQFAQEILQRDIIAYESCRNLTFFERSIVDATAMLLAAKAIERSDARQLIEEYPYYSRVFIFPPWEAIYETDSERDQTFTQSEVVFEATSDWYIECGYELVEVPRVAPQQRADLILEVLRGDAS